MAKRDFYDVLGVARGASKDDLKRAYRKLAMQYHPDRNPGDEDAEQRFKELNEAYDVLKDDDKKAAYDRFVTQHSSPEAPGRGVPAAASAAASRTSSRRCSESSWAGPGGAAAAPVAGRTFATT